MRCGERKQKLARQQEHDAVICTATVQETNRNGHIRMTAAWKARHVEAGHCIEVPCALTPSLSCARGVCLARKVLRNATVYGVWKL